MKFHDYYPEDVKELAQKKIQEAEAEKYLTTDPEKIEWFKNNTKEVEILTSYILESKIFKTSDNTGEIIIDKEEGVNADTLFYINIIEKINTIEKWYLKTQNIYLFCVNSKYLVAKISLE